MKTDPINISAIYKKLQKTHEYSKPKNDGGNSGSNFKVLNEIVELIPAKSSPRR
jgi:hypothetical protein